ncbi:hypothetical protein RFI_03018 [Reticulomyxa filosa]|uniref:DNA-directed DNA polymerase n=1 Tax=Reticulomyxa filosa TaxID=46433 RepID=X6P789_RETFI|nr:hypothetical protein RFI_03018 [Reticulomyxa filosa]|eukprot:ETO34076.1 hypothetical protein RFI_03018 [Reticulomyxa filosa]
MIPPPPSPLAIQKSLGIKHRSNEDTKKRTDPNKPKKLTFNKIDVDRLLSKDLREYFKDEQEANEAHKAVTSLQQGNSITTQIQTYIEPLQRCAIDMDSSPSTRRIFSQLNLNTETGRLSSQKPNLQNQPIVHDKYHLRQAFRTDPNKKLIVADYSQLELRVLAYLSNCKYMLNAFQSGGDFHSRTAVSLFPAIEKEVKEGKLFIDESHRAQSTSPNKDSIPLLKAKFSKERHHAKTIAFGIAYGSSPLRVMRECRLSMDEANALLSSWYKDRPEVKAWQNQTLLQAIQKGKCFTILQRPRNLFQFPVPKSNEKNNELLQNFFPLLADSRTREKFLSRCLKKKNIDISEEWYRFYRYDIKKSDTVLKPSHFSQLMRKAMNTPIQGTAADIVVQAMLNIWNDSQIQKLGFQLVLQVHDELILEGPQENAQQAANLVVQHMQKPWDADLYFHVDIKIVDSWYNAKS